MRHDSCSGPTTDSICGHGLGRMGHSSNFARWPHLGPIPPMDGGGHLVPLSYVYGYRGGVGRRGVAQDTIGDNGLEIRARVRRYQLILSRCAAGFVPKIGHFRDQPIGSTEKRPIWWKFSLRYRMCLGGPRWHTKWLGPIRGRLKMGGTHWWA